MMKTKFSVQQIPAYHASCAEAADIDNVVALEGYTAWLPSNKELKKILSSSVLLDADAAFVLQERGFGRYIGIQVGEKQQFGCVAEKYRIGTINKTTLRIPYRGYRWRDIKTLGAEITSEYIDSQNNYHPGSMIFANKLGGRIAVYNNIGDLSPSGSFGNQTRLDWLHSILQWLSRNTFSVLPKIPHHCLCVVRSNENNLLIALANLGSDVLTEIKFQIYSEDAISSFKILDINGKWNKANAIIEVDDVQNIYSITMKCQLNVFDWLIIKTSG